MEQNLKEQFLNTIVNSKQLIWREYGRDFVATIPSGRLALVGSQDEILLSYRSNCENDVSLYFHSSEFPIVEELYDRVYDKIYGSKENKLLTKLIEEVSNLILTK